MIAAMGRSAFRRVGAERADEWVEKGHKRRHFFAHRLFQLPKCGPDGYKLAERMFGERELGRHWQLLVQADPELVERFPRELFFDDDLLWHQQHLGRPGQVASASVVLADGALHTLVHQSDLVQRIGRCREHKTQIENRFRGWPWMLLNGIVAFAQERSLRTVRVPTAELAMRHTDPSRPVQPYLFERIYDRPAAGLPGTRRAGEWWEIDVGKAAPAAVEPERGSEPIADDRTVCLTHDVERGSGHRDVDPDFARRADESGARALAAMLAAEAGAGVHATYNVVGEMLPEVRGQIEPEGHALAFHSYDHGDGDQLERCRRVDPRLKGYRFPRSIRTAEATNARLAFHNFEWLAAAGPPGSEPRLEDRLVSVPVHRDDFALYTGDVDYDAWESSLLEHAETAPITVVGLHDCYGELWLERYPELLEKLSERARLRTLDEVAADVFLGAAA